MRVTDCGRIALATALALACTCASAATAQEVAYTGGLQFSTGKYLFESRTESVYLLSGVDVEMGRVRLTASLPFIIQNTPWIAYGPVPLPSGGRRAGEITRQTGRGQRRILLPVADVETLAGIGDPLLHADVEVLRAAPGRASIRLGADAKLPVTSASDGFGTGEWDFGASVSVFKSAGVHSLSGDLAFWRFGDMDDLVLEDAWAYSAAYGRALASGRWSVVVSASGFSSIIDGHDPPVQVGVGLGRVFSSRGMLTGMLSFGMTDTAPDISVGLGWRVGLAGPRGIPDGRLPGQASDR
jgi:hypothetical protein